MFRRKNIIIFVLIFLICVLNFVLFAFSIDYDFYNEDCITCIDVASVPDEVDFSFNRTVLFSENSPYASIDRSYNIEYVDSLGVYARSGYEFGYDTLSSLNSIGSDNPNNWVDIETGYDHTNIIADPDDPYDRKVEMHADGDTAEYTGIEYPYFSESGYTTFNFTVDFMFTDLAGTWTVIYFFDIYSSDSTMIGGFRVRHQTSSDPDWYLQFHDGTSNYIVDSIDFDQNITINFCVNDVLDRFYMRWWRNGIFQDNFTIDKSILKDGLTEIHTYIDSASAAGQDAYIYLDSIGLYMDGLPYGVTSSRVISDFSYHIYDIKSFDDWDTSIHNLFSFNATGNFEIVGLEIPYVVSSIDILENYPNYNYYGEYVGNSTLNFYEESGFFEQSFGIMFVVATNYSLDWFSCSGVEMLGDGVSYPLEYSSQNVDIDTSYFYVQSDRLYYQFEPKYPVLQYMGALFNVSNVWLYNNSISFYSDRNGASLSQLRLLCSDQTTGLLDFSIVPAYTNFVLFEEKYLDALYIFVTDNNKLSYDQGVYDSGFIGTIRIQVVPNFVGEDTSDFVLALVPFVVILFGIAVLMYVTKQKEQYRATMVIIGIFVFSFILTIQDIMPFWVFFNVLVFIVGYIGITYKNNENSGGVV